MMDKDWKDKWVIALRSGDYKQGKYKLRNADDSFCCLGVLCDIVDPTKWIVDEPAPYSYSHDGYANHLPTSVRDFVGIDESLTYIMGLNDNGGTFEDIAAYIERNY